MALTTVITGRVALPTDQPAKAAELVFTLTGWDKDGADIFPPAKVRSVMLLADGTIPAGFKLWRNGSGANVTKYDVTLRWSEADRKETVAQETYLGQIYITGAGPFTLASLLPIPVTVPTPPGVLAQAIGAATSAGVDAGRAEDALEDALASEGRAALYGPFTVPDVEALLDLEEIAPGKRYGSQDGFGPWDTSDTGAGDFEIAGKQITVVKKHRIFAPESFGASSNPLADHSTAFERAIDAAANEGGGTIPISGTYNAAGLIVPVKDIVFEGKSRDSRIVVPNSGLGFHVKDSWVPFRKLSLHSEGDMEDGLNTCGILYSKGAGSTGHIYNQDLNIQGFSGFGMEIRNTLDLLFQSVFFRECGQGLKFRREGTGPADFSTTVRLDMVYAIACDVGIDLERVRHARFNHVICEWNRVGIKSWISDFDMEHCYFENNSELGVDSLDSLITEQDCYYNSSTDRLQRTWTPGVIAAADRYYRKTDKGSHTVKRLGLMSANAVDPRDLAAIGSTENRGLKYGEAVIPRIHGRDLLDQAAWTGLTLASEFGGWVPAQCGYLVSHATGGGSPRGMQQSITLDAAKTYVVDFAARNVAGAVIGTVQVDGIAVVPGVPFTVASTGPKVVRAFAAQSVISENYIECFRLMEVLEDRGAIGRSTDLLSRGATQRGNIYASAPPTSGRWAVGEIVKNSAPTVSGGKILTGWICTVAGPPGTWEPMYVSNS